MFLPFCTRNSTKRPWYCLLQDIERATEASKRGERHSWGGSIVMYEMGPQPGMPTFGEDYHGGQRLSLAHDFTASQDRQPFWPVELRECLSSCGAKQSSYHLTPGLEQVNRGHRVDEAENRTPRELANGQRSSRVLRAGLSCSTVVLHSHTSKSWERSRNCPLGLEPSSSCCRWWNKPLGW